MTRHEVLASRLAVLLARLAEAPGDRALRDEAECLSRALKSCEIGQDILREDAATRVN